MLILAQTFSYRVGAFIDAAVKLGGQVVVGSQGDHVLQSINPEGFLNINFDDPELATDAIVGYQESHQIDAIISIGDDGVQIAAMASDALGLLNNPVLAASATRNKYSMRRLFAQYGLPSPGFTRISVQTDPEQIGSEIQYPCVMKPLSFAASRGVIRANNPVEFKTAFHRITNLLAKNEIQGQGERVHKEILIEDFIPGEEVILEGLLRAGQVHTLAIFDKPDPMDGPYFEETILVTPSRKSISEQESILHCAQKMVHALGLREGPIHAEMRVNAEGVYPLEIAARSIGGYCSRALRFAGNSSLEEMIILHALGVNQISMERELQATGVMMIPIPERGILSAVEGIEDAKLIPGIVEITITIPTGHKVIPLPEGNQYLGFIFSRADTPDEAENSLRLAHAALKIRITRENHA